MFQKQIQEYISYHNIFYIKEIQNSLGVTSKQRAILNTELARCEKKGLIKRIEHGLYAVPILTCFGEKIPNESLILSKVYIDDYNGYTTGPTFLNQIGVSTWLSNTYYIKSNNYRKHSSIDNYIVSAPRVRITQDNINYLQLLDCLEDIIKYAVDIENPYEIVYKYIQNSKLDMTKLLLLAYKYYKKSTIEQLYGMVEKYYEIT